MHPTPFLILVLILCERWKQADPHPLACTSTFRLSTEMTSWGVPGGLSSHSTHPASDLECQTGLCSGPPLPAPDEGFTGPACPTCSGKSEPCKRPRQGWDPWSVLRSGPQLSFPRPMGQDDCGCLKGRGNFCRLTMYQNTNHCLILNIQNF